MSVDINIINLEAAYICVMLEKIILYIDKKQSDAVKYREALQYN